MIACALGRRVWIDRGYYKLYPNLYVVLVGKSAKVRKTTAIKLGYDVLRASIDDLCVVSQKVTPEALIQIFREEAERRGVANGVIVSTEFGVFLSASGRGADLIQLLTDWYDCPEVFVYHTVGRGEEKLEKVCCNLIAGTTPDWMKEGMPQTAIGGGFTSRIVFVYQAKPEKLVPFPVLTKEQIELREKLIHDLRVIGELNGEFKLSEDAREWYEEWYTTVFREECSEVELDGYYGRKHDTLLKVSMCVSASRSDEMVIEEGDLRVALKALNAVERYLPQTLKMIEMKEEGKEVEKVMRAIGRREEVDYSTLLRSVSYCMNAKKLQECLQVLIESGLVEEFIKVGKRWYRLKEVR